MTKKFWNKEYKSGEHLALSTEPSSDMLSFVHWAERNAEWHPFPRGGMILDIGCGNGRNIIALSREAKMKGYGFDISGEAIAQANTLGKGIGIKFEVRSAATDLPLPDRSVDVVLDMMTSHFLQKDERENLLKEILRVMKPYGWLFFKSFILEGDQNAARMIKENPGGEENSYIHPKIGVFEHVWTEEGLCEFFAPHFKIHKLIKSYKHVKDGKAWKRRTASLYLEKLP
ncbi:MAG: class I SAM-dependent methyltransferase [Patescibacteria group bacterium]